MGKNMHFWNALLVQKEQDLMDLETIWNCDSLLPITYVNIPLFCILIVFDIEKITASARYGSKYFWNGSDGKFWKGCWEQAKTAKSVATVCMGADPEANMGQKAVVSFGTLLIASEERQELMGVWANILY